MTSFICIGLLQVFFPTSTLASLLGAFTGLTNKIITTSTTQGASGKTANQGGVNGTSNGRHQSNIIYFGVAFLVIIAVLIFLVFIIVWCSCCKNPTSEHSKTQKKRKGSGRGSHRSSKGKQSGTQHGGHQPTPVAASSSKHKDKDRSSHQTSRPKQKPVNTLREKEEATLTTTPCRSSSVFEKIRADYQKQKKNKKRQ